MANFQAGFNVKGNINGVAYSLQSFRCREMAGDLDVSNSEAQTGNPSAPLGPQASNYEMRIAGLLHMEATVTQATFDAANNPFATPWIIGAGAYMSLAIYPAGRSNVRWYAPSFLVLDAGQNGEIPRLQPVDFSGKSDGYYHDPFSSA